MTARREDDGVDRFTRTCKGEGVIVRRNLLPGGTHFQFSRELLQVMRLKRGGSLRGGFKFFCLPTHYIRYHVDMFERVRCLVDQIRLSVVQGPRLGASKDDDSLAKGSISPPFFPPFSSVAILIADDAKGNSAYNFEIAHNDAGN